MNIDRVLRSSNPEAAFLNDSLINHYSRKYRKSYSFNINGKFYEFLIPLEDLVNFTRNDLWIRKKSGKLEDVNGKYYYILKKPIQEKYKIKNTKKLKEDPELRLYVDYLNNLWLRIMSDKLKSCQILSIKKKIGNKAVAKVLLNDEKIVFQYFKKSVLDGNCKRSNNSSNNKLMI